MRLLFLIVLLFSASPVFAAASCAPVSTDARILASADAADVHPDWSDGSRIGLSWSLDLQGDQEGSKGEWYLTGDLIDPKGNVVTSGVYVDSMEWECDSE